MIKKIISFLARSFVGNSKSLKSSASAGLDRKLMDFWTADSRKKKIPISWTLRNALPGVFIFGKPGSGKSSGPGRTIAAALLKSGMGGIVLCAKPEEADIWERLLNEAGRPGDLVRVTAKGPYRLNVLDYENEQSEASTISIVEMLMLIAEPTLGADRKEDSWYGMCKTLLTNAIDLIRLAGSTITFEVIYALIQVPTAYQKLEALAEKRDLTSSERKDLIICADYFGRRWAEMPDKTKGSVIATLTPMLDTLSRGHLRELFSTTTTITPEATFTGKIIIVDLPVTTHYIGGRLAAIFWKLAWQRAVCRRGMAGAEKPAFMYADEFQDFVTSNDATFCLESRSAGGLSVMLTQSILGLWTALGGRDKGQAAAETLFSNCPTKIFCRNDDRETNKYAKELIGRRIQWRGNTSSNYSFSEGGGGGGGGARGSSEQMDYIIEDNYFLSLACGGSQNNHVVTALLYTGNVLPPRSEMFTKTAFKQTS